jgi:hypothetical protein
MMRLVCGLLASMVLCTSANAQLTEWSVWQNVRTSLLVISTIDTAKGTFIGTFINNADGYICKGFAVPITGKFAGGDVSFVANFAPCDNTITVWTGTVSGNTITADFDLWYVADYKFKEIKDTDIFTKKWP